MFSRSNLVALLMVFLLMSVIPVAFAQQRTVDTDQIIAALGPRSSFPGILFDIMLYGIFFIGFITMMLVPDKQIFPSILMVLVLGLAIFSKLEIFDPDELPTFALNVGMFVIPLIVAGMLRGRGKTPKALAPAILTGLIGGGYFFLFWALEQRGS